MGIFGGDPQAQVELDDLKARVVKLEAAVEALQTQAAVPYGAPQAAAPSGAVGDGAAWLAEVRQLKANGKLIEAIKAYREHTGLGLKEAKDAVEALY